jgi:hypothetical protein
VRERDALVSPAPPLHGGRQGRPCRHRGHGVEFTRRTRAARPSLR